MALLNPYLHFNGNTKEAFDFYKSVFGGEFIGVMKFSEVPPGEYTPEPGEADNIMHIALPIGKYNILMGSDVPEKYGKAIIGTNCHISVSTESEEETDKIFNGLAQGGRVTVPLAKTFWNSYFGMLIDKYEVRWMVSFDYNRPK